MKYTKNDILKSGQLLKIRTNPVPILDSGQQSKIGTVPTKSGHMAGIGLWYILASMPVLCVLPVTSQPGSGRGSSNQGLGRDHIQKSM